jgi:signal recognition particle receptor subunit beta
MSEAAWFDRFALGGIIALAMLLIAAVVYAVSSRKRGNTVVIVGPSDSGKTLLFELLVSGKHVSTHTSMVANEHTGVLFIEKTVSPSPGPVNLVDFPGQKRVRGQLQARPAE